MKKLLSIVLLFILSLSLVGCASPSDDPLKEAEVNEIVYQEVNRVVNNFEDDEFQDLLDYVLELEERLDVAESMLINLRLDVDSNKSEIELLKAKVNGLETEIASLGYLEGLNGQRSSYVSYENPTMSNLSMIYLATEIDKDKLPGYMFDEITLEPLEFSDVGERLKLKYFGEEAVIDDLYTVGYQTKLRIMLDGNLSIEDIMARSLLMIEELTFYDYWLLGASEFYLTYHSGGLSYSIIIYMPTVRSDGFNLTLDDYLDENWEININFTFDLEVAQALYDGYVLDESFIDYVLDFTK